MSDIPADIRAKAEKLAETVIYSGPGDILAADLIAEALMEERERCAKIAEAAGRELEPSFMADTAWEIAAAIRSPDNAGKP